MIYRVKAQESSVIIAAMYDDDLAHWEDLW